MRQSIALFALTVRDYDEAIAFYTGPLGFELLEDTDLGAGKRWVRVRPRGSDGTGILLARAVGESQLASVGNQTGGRVFGFVETDDFRRDYEAYCARGVRFVRPPKEEPYGTVAVFADLYGNLFDLIERREAARSSGRDPSSRTGGCACGAVRYELTGQPTKVTYCHCSKCRRWHGHVGAYAAVERSAFRLVEAGALKWYAANEKVQRGFCGECGSSLLWDEEGSTHMAFCPGSIDEPTGLESKAHIYVGSKGDYYELPQDGLLRLAEFK